MIFDRALSAYVDALELSSDTSIAATGSLANSDSLTVGSQDTTDDGDDFNGDIDEVKIFDYAMTQEQVAWLYNHGKPVGHWKMDEGEGSTAKDSSENNNSGTIANATWTTSGKFNSALSFDGSGDYVDVGDSSSLSAISPLTASAWIKTTDTKETGDEVKIYNYALTAEQIKMDYNQGAALRFGD